MIAIPRLLALNYCVEVHTQFMVESLFVYLAVARIVC